MLSAAVVVGALRVTVLRLALARISPSDVNSVAKSHHVHLTSPLCFDRGKLLTSKLWSQVYRKANLVSTVEKFYGRHYDLVDPFNVAVSKLISDLVTSVEA